MRPRGPVTSMQFLLGDFQVCRQSREFAGRGNRCVVSPKALDVLECLLAAGTQCVGRNEIIQAVWDDNFIVGEHGLRDAIWELRKALGDNPRRPEFIQTLPRRGYRLMVLPRAIPMKSRPQLPQLFRPLALAGILVIAGFAYSQWGSEPPAPGQSWSGLAPVLTSDQTRAAAIQEVRGQPDLFIFDLPKTDFGRGLVETGSEVMASAVQITNSSQREWSPVWSPNNRNLAFMEVDERTGSCLVRVFEGRGKTTSALADDCHVISSPVGVPPAQVAWSADGTRVAYQARLNARDVGIVSVDVAEPEKKVLLSSSRAGVSAFPRWNSRGDLAFLHLTDTMMAKGQIVAKNAAGETIMECPPAPVWDMTWIDARHLAAAAAHGNPFGLWVYDTHTGAFTQGQAWGRHLQPNLVGQTILIDHYQMDSPLQLAHLSDRAPTVNLDLHNTPVAVDYAQQSKLLAVATTGNGRTALAVGPLGKPTRVIHEAREIYRPRFSSTGRQIAFSARNSSGENVRALVADLDTGETRYLSSGNQAVFFSEWGSHDQHFYALVGVPSPLGTGATAIMANLQGELVEVLGEGLGLNIIRDGSGALWWADEKGAIYRRSHKSAAPQVIYRLGSAYESWVATAAGELFFTETSPEGTQIKVLRGTLMDPPTVARIVATALDPIIGLVPGPSQTVLFRRSTMVWRGRQSIPVSALTTHSPARPNSRHCLPRQQLAAFP